VDLELRNYNLLFLTSKANLTSEYNPADVLEVLADKGQQYCTSKNINIATEAVVFT